MKIIISGLLYVLLLLKMNPVTGQQIKFNHVFNNNNSGYITAMAQDHQGYIWFTNQNTGLQRYDGIEFKTYAHDPKDPKSLAANYGECLWIDNLNIIWIGTWGTGLDRFDPSINTSTHFRHDPKDGSSLSSDTVTAMLEDHLGNFWIGTFGGLDLLDKKTGKFKHYTNKPSDSYSLSDNQIRVIYEDRSGTLWVGCGSPILNNLISTTESGGLNRFDRTTGKFKRYLHNPHNPNSIATNKVRAIFEDSKGNFWIGTSGDGLQTLERTTGTFTHYYYDPAHPEKLSRPPLNKTQINDHITFITEDATGAIWIGSFLQGINRYDPRTKIITHYGPTVQVVKGRQITSFKDTTAGFKDTWLWGSMVSKDGIIWFCNLSGNIYNVNPLKTTIPYYPIINGLNGNTFYHEQKSNILWIGTNKGLVRKNLNNQAQKTWLHDPLNSNSLSDDFINAMRVDDEGKFWMATNSGLCKFDPGTNTFTTYRHSEKNTASLSSNYLNNLCIDGNKNVWIATVFTGLDKLDTKTGVFTNYRYNRKNSASLSNNQILCVVSSPGNEIWAGSASGLNRLNHGNGKFRHYLTNLIIKSIFFDKSGIAWVGTQEELYYYEKASDQMLLFVDPIYHVPITGVLHVLEDDKNNLWVSTVNGFVKINEKRSEVKRYGKSYGVHINSFYFSDNFKSKNGQLFFGDQTGYYSFFPDQLKGRDESLTISFTGFKLGNQEITAGTGSVLKVPIWKINEIKLNYDQNVFSFDFIAISYIDPGDKKYLFRLENYDNTWQDIGNDHKAYFFNVPPGRYIFHVRGVNSDGVWSEKSIRIIITPPWWKTWWAYTLFALLFIGAVWGFIYYRSRALRHKNRVLEEKVAQRTKQLNQSLEDLKSTQSQLIQSEKMASLGELTAGIAHEIQNPLNFVNNFSEVNSELIIELKQEIDKGNMAGVKTIADDISLNERKIAENGKRADAIVKGMLQHSRSNTGVKGPVSINAMADEFLLLAYHSLRARDKSFNVTLKSDFDNSIGKINVVPQEIGRVILNLLNNAFYAITEKKKLNIEGYEPIVSLTTKKAGDKVEIRVNDNGSGIPPKVINKIFQPFFTTKPAGQGTGLGLSLSYDVITKGHGGELMVETNEEEGSTFIIRLPA